MLQYVVMLMIMTMRSLQRVTLHRSVNEQSSECQYTLMETAPTL